MEKAVLMLYGAWSGEFGQHPWNEDMFKRPDQLQAMFAAQGYEFHVAQVTHSPTGQDELPDVRIARNPVYDQRGVLQEADFRPGTIEAYPAVIDHWVHNFQAEVKQPDGTFQKTAYGIGLPAERLWNHRSIQTMGNRKDLMDVVLSEHGVAIPTYGVLEHARLEREQGDGEIIYKPQGGARARGIRDFRNVAALRTAIRDRELARNGLIQLMQDIHTPIRGLVAASPEEQAILEEINSNDRPREIRMHALASTNPDGQLQAETYPTVRFGERGAKTMKTIGNVALDPDCLGPGSYLHDKSAELAKAVCIAAGEPGKPIPQYYGVFDWIGSDLAEAGNPLVVDANCRGPTLPIKSWAARAAFVNVLVRSGNQVLATAC